MNNTKTFWSERGFGCKLIRRSETTLPAGGFFLEGTLATIHITSEGTYSIEVMARNGYMMDLEGEYLDIDRAKEIAKVVLVKNKIIAEDEI